MAASWPSSSFTTKITAGSPFAWPSWSTWRCWLPSRSSAPSECSSRWSYNACKRWSRSWFFFSPWCSLSQLLTSSRHTVSRKETLFSKKETVFKSIYSCSTASCSVRTACRSMITRSRSLYFLLSSSMWPCLICWSQSLATPLRSRWPSPSRRTSLKFAAFSSKSVNSRNFLRLVWGVFYDLRIKMREWNHNLNTFISWAKWMAITTASTGKVGSKSSNSTSIQESQGSRKTNSCSLKPCRLTIVLRLTVLGERSRPSGRKWLVIRKNWMRQLWKKWTALKRWSRIFNRNIEI